MTSSPLVEPCVDPPALRRGKRPFALRSAARRRELHLGLTLVELLLVVTIIGVLLTLAVITWGGWRDRVDQTQAVTDIVTISGSVGQYKLDYRDFPPDLATVGKGAMRDPWGNPYEYVSHSNVNGNGKFRKDKNIVPINSDFDLWSNGKDGRSSSPLTAHHSRDDIIRANDGGFVGPASLYDP